MIFRLNTIAHMISKYQDFELTTIDSPISNKKPWLIDLHH